jgi:hypothetical protein
MKLYAFALTALLAAAGSAFAGNPYKDCRYPLVKPLTQADIENHCEERFREIERGNSYTTETTNSHPDVPSPEVP